VVDILRITKTIKLLIVATSALIIGFGCVAAVDNFRQIQHTQREIQRLESERQDLHKKTEQLEQEKHKNLKQIEDQKKTEDQLKQEIEKLQAAKAEKARLAALTASPKAFAAEPVKASGSCADWMAAAGIPLTNATNTLILKESGCSPTAVNPSSGACGIPQALPCSKISHCGTEPVCQLKWMDQYVKGRYGTWESALSTWYSRSPHWY